ncbi:hypothetical protein CAter10_1165 [Collimonas arenae]|nr:hypothetical protein CAter10_1165 [Collimonas arenae]
MNSFPYIIHAVFIKTSAFVLGIRPSKPAASMGASVGQYMMQSVVGLIVGSHDLIANCCVDYRSIENYPGARSHPPTTPAR